jgi:hypothetical protein
MIYMTKLCPAEASDSEQWRGGRGGGVGETYNGPSPVTRLGIPEQKLQNQREKMKKGKRSKANKNKMEWTS